MSNPSPYSIIDPPSLSNFTPEIRQAILTHYTNLLSNDTATIPNIHINNGEISHPASHFINLHSPSTTTCTCDPLLPTTLLSPSSLDPSTLHTILSRNRLIFSGSPAKSLSFLRAQEEHVQMIRYVDFQFLPDDIEQWNNSSTKYKIEWEDLMRYIAEHLTLTDLILSLDAGPCYPIYVEQNLREYQIPYVLEAYKSIVDPVREQLGVGQKEKKEGGLKGFYVYWACFHDNEGEAERQVMGKEYVAEGKIGRGKREPFYPHGCAWEVEEGMELI